MEPVVLEQPASSADGPLHRKFGSAEAPLAGEPVVYEFTNDPGLLHQYYRLRAEMFRQKRNVEFSYGADGYDSMSHTLIARKGKLCIGGVRLTLREPDEDWLLPMENSSFLLKKTLPHLDWEHCRHAQLSRLAVLEDYNNQEILYNLCAMLDRLTKELEVTYAFCRAPMTHCRMWKKMTNRIGDYHAEILEDVKIPDVESYGEEYGKEYLVMAVATQNCIPPRRPRVPIIDAH